jgi:hypothetical protein
MSTIALKLPENPIFAILIPCKKINSKSPNPAKSRLTGPKLLG